MDSLLEKIANCTERGKANRNAPYPPDLKGQDGADELTAKALADGADPNRVLNEGLMLGMNRVGEKFGRNEVFVPDLLMAARGMGYTGGVQSTHFSDDLEALLAQPPPHTRIAQTPAIRPLKKDRDANYELLLRTLY